jgi:hypothetical protein
MAEPAQGFVGENDHVPAFGRRVAEALGAQMRARLMGVAEVAIWARCDKRDVRRLLSEQVCGWRLFECLAEAFGWDFVESVMTPVVGADPVTAREKELAAHEAQVAALHARLQRERSCRSARVGVGSGQGGGIRLLASSQGRGG